MGFWNDLFTGKYAKFWAAWLAGSGVASVSVLIVWLVSLSGAYEAPGPDEIRTAVEAFVVSFFSAVGAALATNAVTYTRAQLAAMLAQMDAEDRERLTVPTPNPPADPIVDDAGMSPAS
jgi:hypothetical protein